MFIYSYTGFLLPIVGAMLSCGYPDQITYTWSDLGHFTMRWSRICCCCPFGPCLGCGIYWGKCRWSLGSNTTTSWRLRKIFDGSLESLRHWEYRRITVFRINQRPGLYSSSCRRS